jgi:hypothetical protein
VTPEAWTAVGVIVTALSGVLVALIKAHRSTEQLRAENTRQHGDSYDLLQSMDNRLHHIDLKLDSHGERLAVVEQHLKEQQ